MKRVIFIIMLALLFSGCTSSMYTQVVSTADSARRLGADPFDVSKLRNVNACVEGNIIKRDMTIWDDNRKSSTYRLMQCGKMIFIRSVGLNDLYKNLEGAVLNTATLRAIRKDKGNDYGDGWYNMYDLKWLANKEFVVGPDKIYKWKMNNINDIDTEDLVIFFRYMHENQPMLTGGRSFRVGMSAQNMKLFFASYNPNHVKQEWWFKKAVKNEMTFAKADERKSLSNFNSVWHISGISYVNAAEMLNQPENVYEKFANDVNSAGDQKKSINLLCKYLSVHTWYCEDLY